METRYVFSQPVFASVNTSSTLPLSLQKDEVYLNLVLEYVPETVYRASRHYAKLKQVMPMLQVKLYMYQVSLGSRDRIQ
jgi:hypothetical protein